VASVARVQGLVNYSPARLEPGVSRQTLVDAFQRVSGATVIPRSSEPIGGLDLVRLLARDPVAEVRAVTEATQWQPTRPGEHEVMFWNIEHTERDLDARIGAITGVIRSTNGGRGPDILAMAEIADASVLERMQHEMPDLGYHHARLFEDPRTGPFNNALLSRYPVIESKTHPIDASDPDLWGFQPVAVGEATLDVNGEPLTVFVVHMPTKKGGFELSTRRQVAVGAFVRELIQQRLAQDPKAKIITVGDFNIDPHEAALGPAGLDGSVDPHSDATLHHANSALLDAAHRDPSDWRDTFGPALGTWHSERFGGWHMLDHALVSRGLLGGGLHWSGRMGLARAAMTDEDGTPVRRISDHFPIVLRLAS
jgi:endonuclease/exonuclease/phosphatase family metal-dependent hydrolase